MASIARSKFKVEVDLSNAAFDDDPVPELERILRKIKYGLIEAGDTAGTIFDSNGNRVGNWSLK